MEKTKETKIKFKVIDAINGPEYHKNNKLDKIIDSKKIYEQLGRKMSPSGMVQQQVI